MRPGVLALCLGVALAHVRDITITINHVSLVFTYEDSADMVATATHICQSFGISDDAACRRHVVGAIDDQCRGELGFLTPAWRDADLNLSAAGVSFVQVGANCGKPECAVCGEPVWAEATSPLRGARDAWRGVVVEPNPAVFRALRANYAAANPRVVAVELAVCAADGAATLHVNRAFDETASLVAPAAAGDVAGAVVDEVRVECVSLATLWTRAVAPTLARVDVLLLDIERMEAVVLLATDFAALVPRPRHVLYESVHLSAAERSDVRAHLASFGYARFRGWEGCSDPEHDMLASLVDAT